MECYLCQDMLFCLEWGSVGYCVLCACYCWLGLCSVCWCGQRVLLLWVSSCFLGCVAFCYFELFWLGAGIVCQLSSVCQGGLFVLLWVWVFRLGQIFILLLWALVFLLGLLLMLWVSYVLLCVLGLVMVAVVCQGWWDIC